MGNIPPFLLCEHISCVEYARHGVMYNWIECKETKLWIETNKQGKQLKKEQDKHILAYH